MVDKSRNAIYLKVFVRHAANGNSRGAKVLAQRLVAHWSADAALNLSGQYLTKWCPFVGLRLLW